LPRIGLGVRGRHVLDAKNLVEHSDTGA
jgi:hypothetical protein